MVSSLQVCVEANLVLNVILQRNELQFHLKPNQSKLFIVYDRQCFQHITSPHPLTVSSGLCSQNCISIIDDTGMIYNFYSKPISTQSCSREKWRMEIFNLELCFRQLN